MEHNEITPAPVATAEDLLAKVDMLISATKQWINTDDDTLGAAIYRRVNEIPSDISAVHITPEHAEVFNHKAVELNRAFRMKTYVELSALNSLN